MPERGTLPTRPSSLFTVGDRVRYTHFGEWLEGVVVEILDGSILAIETPIGGKAYRQPLVHEVIHAD